MFLHNAANFGVGSTFSQGPPFLKVRFIKYDIWWLTLEAHLEPSRTSTMKLFFSPLNTITNFCLDISKLKLLTFTNFFSTINFCFQCPPEAKAYLELSRISAMKIFRECFLFLHNSQESTCAGVFFLIKL